MLVIDHIDNFVGYSNVLVLYSNLFAYAVEETISIDFLCLFMQRIPKSISEAVNIPVAGVAVLSMNQEDGVQADFARCADGRTRFTSGWYQFALHYDLVPGVNVMMFLSMDNW